MNRLSQIDPVQATGKVKDLFGKVTRQLGVVPNLHRVIGNAPAALHGYVEFGRALAGGRLDAKVREQIALTVAESNGCGYCLSAHSYLGEKAGLDAAEIDAARCAMATVPGTDAILKLARAVVVNHGAISDADFEQARRSGLTDQEIVETIANVAINVFTNYINLVARTVVDFPGVVPGVYAELAGACHA
jgi:uncharacterized peroxidase-related enzyme